MVSVECSADHQISIHELYIIAESVMVTIAFRNRLIHPLQMSMAQLKSETIEYRHPDGIFGPGSF